MGPEHFVGKVVAKGIIAAPSGRVLVCRNEGDEVWDLPGGTLNFGERGDAALVREMQEELGVEPEHLALMGSDIFIKKKTGKQCIVLFYTGLLATEPDTFAFDDGEIAEAKWINAEDMKAVQLFSEYHHALEVFFAKKEK